MRRAAWSAMLLLLAACGAPAASVAPSSTTSTAPTTRMTPTAATSADSVAASPSALPSLATTATPAATTTPHVTASPTTLQVEALDAPVQGPRGLAFDALGNMYVTECLWTWAAIDRIDPSGMVTRFAGTGTPGFSGDGGPAIRAELFCPTGVAIGPDGAVYFADHVNNRIRRVDAAGVITTFAGSGPAGLDLGSFSGDGGPATQATLQEPWGIAFDQTGGLYIADRDNGRVRVVDTNGVITTVAGTGMPGATGDYGPATQAKICPPVGVAIVAGTLIIPDACESTIREVVAEGTILTINETDSPDVSPDTGSEGNAIAGPNVHDWLFIQSGPRILRMDALGDLAPFAGNGSIGVPIDGSAAVDSPLPLEIWGLAADSMGNVYVADGATSVWRIDTDAVITRFAGMPL